LNCIDSFYEFSDPKQFDIFIADTGSTNEEIEIIKELINKVDNIKLIQYDYYNFAKINNDVVKNYVGNEYEFILFSNNDIKIVSDIVNGMMKIFKEIPKVGTVGCRLHYEDNTIQHDGIVFTFDEQFNLTIEHKNVKTYYPQSLGINKVNGNTAGLMMIRKFTFDKCGGFNENYSTCFEDVELNMKCILMGLDNYCDSGLVAYHYESQTRTNAGKNEGERNDYVKILLPFIMKNIKILGNKLKFVKK
jgi:GT2 family glycosyltransferase